MEGTRLVTRFLEYLVSNGVFGIDRRRKTQRGNFKVNFQLGKSDELSPWSIIRIPRTFENRRRLEEKKKKRKK
jgi:hypothetical protein